MDEKNFKAALALLVAGQTRPAPEQIENVFDFFMSGAASEAQIASFLTALHLRGEQAEDIAAAARSMRKNMIKVNAPPDAIDTCGTGGDMKSTLNISTAAALVIAACDVPVAKHGNRAQSSQSGSADLLAYLGCNLDSDAFEKSIREVGIGFMFAQNHHAAMRHVAPVRAALGFRTIFNLVGPLSNPAGVTRQFTGVFDQKWVRPVAEALQKLGCQRAWVVHGQDGMDELTTTTSSHVAQLNQGEITCFDITPEDANLPRAQPQELVGGAIADNAQALKNLLDGQRGAYHDIVVLNAAGALIVAERAENLKQGAELAAEAIASGRAAKILKQWIKISNE